MLDCSQGHVLHADLGSLVLHSLGNLADLVVSTRVAFANVGIIVLVCVVDQLLILVV